ncbi:MAG: hypothetical protein DMF86_04010, partial [Acidobacteria bacterium]
TLPLGSSLSLPAGERIVAIGAPNGFDNTISDGLLAAIRHDNGHRYLQITAPVSHGSSGGPVLDKDGKVIGVVVGTIEGGQNLNFAIAVEEVTTLLNRHPIQKPLPDRGASALEQAAQTAFAAKQFKRAAQLFGAVLLLRPHDSASAYNTGLALFNAGDKQKAHSYFARFVRDAPLTEPDLLRIRNWLVSQSVANPDDARSRPTQMDFAVNPDTTPEAPAPAASFQFDVNTAYTFKGNVGGIDATLHLTYRTDAYITGVLSFSAPDTPEVLASAVRLDTGIVQVKAGTFTLRGPITGDGLFSGSYSVEGTARGGTFRFQFAE